MKKLTRAEMKNVVGGFTDETRTYSCTCYGCVGAWEYTNGVIPSNSQFFADVETYCRTNEADCSWNTPA